MKAILQSIKPQHCANIAAHIKKIEVRKTKPNVPTPFKVYIYCTKGEKLWKKGNSVFLDKRYNRLLQTFDYMLNGKIIGEYVCNYITTDFLISDTCISVEDLEKYSGNKTIYGWHISNLVIYDKPKELSEFQKCYTVKNINNPDFHYKEQMLNPLTRPPQSWCYVEEV